MLSIKHIKTEIRIVGLQRSGNHAIINWIMKQSGGNALFFNDIEPENPLEPTRMSSSYIENINPGGAYDCVIYSYEDRLLNLINREGYYPQNNIYNTTVDKRFDIVIIRNPFNVFASRLKHGSVSSAMGTYISGLSIPQLWITYACEYLKKTNHLKNTFVPVNYDRWCASLSYRREVAEALELNFTDEGFTEITRYGQGSSFDRTEYDAKADQMTTDQRWKSYTDSAEFRKLFADPLITDLSRQIFQLDPDLECFIEESIHPEQTRVASVLRWVKIACLPEIVVSARESSVIKFLYQFIFMPIRKMIIANRS